MDEFLNEIMEPATPRAETERRHRVWSTVAILGLAGLGLTSLTTGAIFTDSDSSSTGSVTTGTVDLAVDGTQLAVPVNALAPGSSFTREIPVANAGSLALRYAVGIKATPDNPSGTAGIGNLADQLTVELYGNATCSGTALASTTGIPSTQTNLLGDPSVGAQPGDRVLNASGSESLCMRVTFALGASNDYQNTGSQIALTFSSEQTVNND